MANVKLVEVDEAEGEVRLMYEGMIATRGTVANLFLALGHSPKLLGPAIALATFVGAEGSAVPARDKQLAYLATSRLNGCHYCLERHAVAGAKAGLTSEQVAAVLAEQGDLLESGAFDPKEKLIISYAQELTRGIKAQPETLSAMKETFNQEEFLELTYVVATANMFNRLADGLDIELEPEFKK